MALAVLQLAGLSYINLEQQWRRAGEWEGKGPMQGGSLAPFLLR